MFKVLQRAVLTVMEPVYEQDFLDCSYGFRPGRGAHQALQAQTRSRVATQHPRSYDAISDPDGGAATPSRRETRREWCHEADRGH